MDFDLEVIAENEEQKEIDELWIKYNEMGFSDFDTWYKTDKQIVEELKKCIEKNKSHEELYGKEEIKEEIDY